MSKVRNRMLFTMVLGLLMAAPAFAQTQLSIVCRCVAGGVNSQEVDWITNYVIPQFQDQMKAQGSDVTVTLTQFGGSDEALKQQYALDLSVKKGHDVMAFDGFWIPEFATGELLKPLSQISSASTSWEGWDHISTGIQSILSYNGEIYGIPMGTDVRMIFYRTDKFADAGIATPWQPTSWNDITDAAQKLKAADAKSFPLQINAGTNMGEATTLQGYYMLLLGTGEEPYMDGKWVTKSQGILDTLNYYKTIYVDNQLGDTRAQLIPNGREQSFANFRDGITSMLVESDYFYRSVTAADSEFAVADRDKVMSWAKMPAEEPGKGVRGQDFVTASGGTGFVVNPNSSDPEMAWQLAAFMFSKASLDDFEQIQPRISSRDDVSVPNDEFLTTVAHTLLPFTVARPNNDDYAQVSEAIERMTENVVSGQMSPEDAMNTYADAVTQIVGADNTVDKMAGN